MPERFDPYHRWLGIPPEDQPPNYYVLLGLRPFESEADVIQSAADQRMGHLRTFQTGEHSALSQQLLNEVAAARLCLLSPAKKADYDEKLRAKLAKRWGLLVAAPLEPKSPAPFDFAQQDRQPGRVASRAGTDRTKRGLVLGAAGVAGVLVVALLVWALGGGGGGPEDRAAKQDVGRPAPPPPPPASPPRGTEAPPAGPETPPTGPEPSSAGPEIPSGPSPPVDSEPTPGGTPSESAESPQVEHGEASGGPRPEGPPPDVAPPDQAAEPAARLPLPPQADRQRALKDLGEIFEFSELKTPREKLDLAGRLRGLAGETQKPVERFVLRYKAMELAREGGDAALMLDVVEAIAAEFDVDALGVKQSVLLSFARDATDRRSIGSLVKSGMPVVDEAVAEHRYDAALAITEAMYAACLRPAGVEYRKQVYDHRRALTELGEAREQFLGAVKKLETNPEDAEAHLLVGRWYCLREGDWERGLPHLTKGSDAGLRAAAENDLAGPTDPDPQIAVADAWWDLAQSADEQDKLPLLGRAGYWYRQAEPRVVSVLLKEKIARRLAEVGQAGRLASAASAGQEPPAGQQEPPEAGTDVKSGLYFVRQAKRGLWARIVGAGNNHNEVRLNGAPLMKCDRGKASSAAAVLKEGDVLTVKTGDRFDIMSHWMVFFTREGEYLFQTSDDWIAYLPKDKQQWWNVRNIKPETQKARYAPDSREYVNLIQNAAEKALPTFPKARPIYSPMKGESQYGDAYLYHVLTVEDLLPKKPPAKDEPLSPDRTPAPPAQPTAPSAGAKLPSFDPGRAQLVATLKGHEGWIGGLAFSRAGTVLASGSLDKTVRFWSVPSGKPAGMLGPLKHRVDDLALSPDGSILASGSIDRTVKLWDVATGELQRKFDCFGGDVWWVLFSPDGTLLACSFGKTVHVWEMPAGRLRHALAGHSQGVARIAFHPNGSQLAVLVGHSVEPWDMTTGELKGTLAAQDAGDLKAIAFSPDGSFLAATGKGKIVKLWRSPDTGKNRWPRSFVTRRTALTDFDI